MTDQSVCLIKQKDPQFNYVLDLWITNILLSISHHPVMSESIHPFVIDFLVNEDKSGLPPERIISHQIRRSYISLSKSYDCETAFIMYDPDFANIHQLEDIIHSFGTEKTRQKIRLSCSDAQTITSQLSDTLMSLPIPDMNIICVQFVGPNSRGEEE